MKEHGENGSTTTRGLLHPTTSPHLSSPSSDKLLRDQELHHLVTSSIPSPPYHHHHNSISLMNAQAAGLVLDPIYSTHLFASLVAANAANASSPLTAGTRFQLPIPIPLALQPASHQHHLQPHLHHQRNLFHHLPATAPTTAFAGLPGATLPNQAQMEILSSWVANSDDKKITSTTSSTPNSTVSTGSSKSANNNKTNNKGSSRSKKNGSGHDVTAKNNKNIQNGNIQKQKRSGGSGNNKKNGKSAKTERNNGNNHHHLLLNEGIVSSSENELPMLKDAKVVVVDKEPMMTINESIIQPFIFDNFPPLTPKSGKKSGRESGGTSPHNNNNNIHSNNNNNTITNLKSQTSPGGGQNGGPRDKVFTCTTCNRCFGYKHVLQNHERTHTGEKPFECSICAKKFTRDHHLKTHMRLHTGEKPYQCTHCDRQFVQVANLRRHLRVHTGERPYACELCSSRFSDSNQLKAHMLIHKGEKPYTCNECGGKFRRRHHLAHHKCSSSSPDTSEELMSPKNSSMSSSSPPQLLTPSSTGGGGDLGTGIGGGSVNGGGVSAEKGSKDAPGKRGRKCRETRRIIRLEGIPVAAQAVTTSTALDGVKSILGGGAKPAFHLPVAPPEQDHPEDLSMTGGLRVRHYSGSSSSVTASSTPSPRGPGVMLLSTRPYSSSSSFEDPPDLYASDEDLRAADSSTNGKIITENESSSMSD